jgi:hypothetical protein
MGSAGTACYFRDTNKNILIEDTLHVSPSFNEFHIINSGSTIEWTGIQITALGTQSKGLFTVTNNALVNLTGCTFIDMSSFSLLPRTSVNTTTFRRCGQITQSGSSIVECDIINSPATTAILSTNLSGLTDNTFTSTGIGHAVQLTSLGSGSMDWKNYLNNYASTNGTSGNEAIYVNVASGTLAINVFAGYDTPSIRTAGAVVTLVISPVTTTITVSDVSTGALIENARVLVEVYSGGSENYRESVTITNTGTTAYVVHTSHGLVTGDKVRIIGAAQTPYNGVKSITVTSVSGYTYTTSGSPASPATGTITSTTVIIDALTNASGVVTNTRSLSTNQPIRGRARKSTTPPLYKTAPIVAIIDNTSGLDLAVQMIPDV